MGGQQGGGTSPPTPQDSAQAQAMAQAAGTKFNIATSPVQAYAEAMNQVQFNPIFQRLQGATNANSALQNAKANQATSAITNPYGSSGADAFNRAASNRLSSIMGQASTPGLTATDTSGAFNYPKQNELPDLNTIRQQAQQISGAIPNIKFWGPGGDNTQSWLMYNQNQV